MAPRLVVSEFPNDNPELHDGLVWACPTPCAPALPTLRLRPSGPARVLRPDWEAWNEESAAATAVVSEPVVQAAPAEAEPTVVESAPVELAAEETDFVEPAPEESAPDPLSENGFRAFVSALAAILTERGATRAAANVAGLFGQARLARDAFDAETKKTLVARGFLDAKTGRPTPELSVVARAWRDVLEGTSADLSGCANSTLDVWGAELLAALLSSPRERSEELRRALRQRGVAAFGMLAAA